MALKVSAQKAAEVAIGSIGRGYDIAIDLRLKYCKGDLKDSRLIEIDEDGGREIVLPGGISIPNVSKSIKCDKGERTRFRSDVLSFQQVILNWLTYLPIHSYSCQYYDFFFLLVKEVHCCLISIMNTFNG